MTRRPVVDERTGLGLPLLTPLMIECFDPAGLRCRVRQVECAAGNRHLHIWLIRRPGGIAQREIGKDRPRRVHRLGDRPRARDRRRGNSGGFECSCDQTDRLVTHRSNGHQQRNIGLEFGDPVDDRWHEGLAETTLTVDAAHERKGNVGEATDLAGVDHRP